MKRGTLARGQCVDCGLQRALRRSDGMMLPHYCGSRGYRVTAPAIQIEARREEAKLPADWGKLGPGLELVAERHERRLKATAFAAVAAEARRRGAERGVSFGVTQALSSLARWCEQHASSLVGSGQLSDAVDPVGELAELTTDHAREEQH